MSVERPQRLRNVGVALISLGAPLYAVAQSTSSDTQAEPSEGVLDGVVVTGSSLRGVPPVGSNLIELARDDVVATGATTVQELLATVPQFATFNR